MTSIKVPKLVDLDSLCLILINFKGLEFVKTSVILLFIGSILEL